MTPPVLQKDEAGLLRHGTLMIVGTFAGSLCNAGFHMAVGRTLPNAEYGALAAMLGIVLAASNPMLAVQNTLAHFISGQILAGRREEVLDFFLHWLKGFIGISAGLVALAVIFRAPLAAFWGGVDPRLVVLTFAVLAASLWMNLFYGVLQGVQAFGWLAWAPQAWGAVRLALGWFLTATIAATALAAMTAQGLGVATVLVVCTWALSRLHLARNPAARRPRGAYRYLGSAFLCLSGFGFLMNLDTTLAKHFFDPETAGRFARAATIARTAVFLPVPIAAALFPKVTSTGELTPESWRLLGKALAMAGLLLTAVAAVCLLWPQLPWIVLYGPWPAAEAAQSAALTRAMVLAMCPLALVYLLLNFEMAQRRFAWAYGLLGCAAAYVGGVASFHDHPLRIAQALGAANLAALLLLTGGILRQPRR